MQVANNNRQWNIKNQTHDSTHWNRRKVNHDAMAILMVSLWCCWFFERIARRTYYQLSGTFLSGKTGFYLASTFQGSGWAQVSLLWYPGSLAQSTAVWFCCPHSQPIDWPGWPPDRCHWLFPGRWWEAFCTPARLCSAADQRTIRWVPGFRLMTCRPVTGSGASQYAGSWLGTHCSAAGGAPDGYFLKSIAGNCWGSRPASARGNTWSRGR